jgi:hypothetical protein
MKEEVCTNEEDRITRERDWKRDDVMPRNMKGSHLCLFAFFVLCQPLVVLFERVSGSFFFAFLCKCIIFNRWVCLSSPFLVFFIISYIFFYFTCVCMFTTIFDIFNYVTRVVRISCLHCFVPLSYLSHLLQTVCNLRWVSSRNLSFLPCCIDGSSHHQWDSSCVANTFSFASCTDSLSC